MAVPPSIDPVVRLRNLSQLSSSVSVDDTVPPRRYLRSGLEMERMANVYFEEGNIEHAFILYTKLITLIVEKLPKHAHYKEVPLASKQNSKKRIKVAFQKAEDLKVTIKKKYEEEFEIWETKEAEKKKEFEKAEQERIKKEKEEQLKEMEQRQYKQNHEAQNITSSSAVLLSGITPVSRNNSSTHSNLEQQTVPTVPDYPMLNQHTEKYIKPPEVERKTPVIDRATKPDWMTDFVHGLRVLNVPTELMRKFISMASPNTRQNHETCGILAGKLSQNVFYITHLIIPKQTSTSDSCTTLNEEDIFVYQDSHDLLTLGWIHTHPSQTAFMSSIDLHTHCSYQLMLPEAIAIVCAPKHSQTGMFTLTNDHGLKFISACKQQGFHPHPKEPPIYEDGKHVRLDELSSITVADLR